jgi:putative tryptophan/tyrosine transport system substrate-binding protein
MRRRVPRSLPGLTSQVGFTRLATLKIAQLGQARAAVQSILLRKKMDARVISAFTRVFRRAMPAHDGAKILRRREFILALGGAAVAWPLAARAQQGSALPRVGVLFGIAENDPEGRNRVDAFRQGLEKLGWIAGKNLQMHYRWGGGGEGLERMRAQATELVRLKPDVLLAGATLALVALRQATRDIPIVFAQVTDPVGAGFVESLARPGGNITGFTQHEFAIGVKWLELLKELAPRVKRVAVIYDAANPASTGYLATITPVAPTFGVELTTTGVRSTPEVERAIDAIAATADGGIIVLPGPAPSSRRERIIALAERHRLPAVYAFRYWVVSGGLASYGIDNVELYRLAATYVDRILKGEKPADLPVQHATKFQLVINLKTAKALGLDLPITLLARTDEVIE